MEAPGCSLEHGCCPSPTPQGSCEDPAPSRCSPSCSFPQPLDYELIRQYIFTIEATDPTVNLRYLSGISGRNKARVIINVTDVDEPPVFQQHFYHFLLQENLKKPLVGSVLASDPDEARRSIG